MSELNFSGGCQCGIIRFETNADPKFVSNCHCAPCRKATGAAFATWIGFAENDVRWTAAMPDIFHSSPGVSRGFCRACGTPLTYAGVKWPGELHILIGALDNPALVEPRSESFTNEALPWTLKERRF